MNRIPIAIVGLNFGRHIINQLTEGPASHLFNLAAVCDLDPEKAATFGQRFKVPHFTDLDTLLQEAGIPCIGLFTGPAGRSPLLRRIVDAGKDIITTKPFEVDADAALEILRYAASQDRVLHLNSPGPCLSPDLACIEAWQNDYDLGAPVSCQQSVWVRYNEQAGPEGNWLDDPLRCPVAPIFRLGIYLINDLVSLLGEAAQISVLSSRLNTGRPTPDNAQLGLLFQNGAIASISANFCCADGDHYRNSMELHYERGSIYRNCGPNRDPKALGEMTLVMGTPEGGRRIEDYQQVESMSGDYQWEAFAKAHRGETLKLSTTPEKIVAGLRIIEAMSRADQADGYAQVENSAC